MRVALVHDWLVGMRGGEKCLESFCELFPQADLYTLVYAPEKISRAIRAMNVRPSWFNRIPGVKRLYRYGLPLFPRLAEGFDLRNYELVLSSSHCVAKGVFPHRALHIAYIHAPMRYVWDMHDAYFGAGAPPISRAAMGVCRSYLQRWDAAASHRVDFFIANSMNVAQKIKKFYQREAEVVHPPVDWQNFRVGGEAQSFYLIVSALVPYKRVELAIAAFNDLALPLKVVGEGPLRRRLQKLSGPTIEFLGWVESAELAALYRSCQALIFPGEDDFGIAPLEAQASGRPVIAYGRGGALESVVPLADSQRAGNESKSPTGIFFDTPTRQGLASAVALYQRMKASFDPWAIREHAAQFSSARFKAQIKDLVAARLDEWQRGKRSPGI